MSESASETANGHRAMGYTDMRVAYADAADTEVKATRRERNAALGLREGTDTEGSAYERFTAALDAHGCDSTGSGTGKRWFCPVHGGNSAALVVTDGGDRVLIDCKSGACPTSDVAAALGLRMRDLFDTPLSDAEPEPGPVPEFFSTPHPEAARYEYRNEDGTTAHYNVRGVGKTFHQENADGVRSMDGVHPVLYKLRNVLKTCAGGGVIDLCEGEKDCYALNAVGLVPTTVAAGAGAKWLPSYTESLRGASLVRIWQDNDDPGRKCAETRAAYLREAGLAVEVVQARTGKDPWDHFAAGWTLADAVPVVAAVDPVDALMARLLDTEALDSIRDPEPLIRGWLTLETLCRVNGEPGSGKSLVALDWAACIGTGVPWNGHEATQGNVVYIVAEGVRGFKKRVRAWEQKNGRRMTGVYFLPEPLQVMGPEWDAYTKVCQRLNAKFIVLDTQRRVTVGIKENDNTELGLVVERLDQLKRDTGACVMLAHHTPKGGEGGSGGGSVMGGINTEFMMVKKKNGTTRYVLENTKEKDEDEGATKTFVLEVIVTREEDPFDFTPAQTSVVLVQEESDDYRDDPLPDLPGDMLPSQAKVMEIIRRIWRGADDFTKTEVKQLTVPKSMALATFKRAWNDLVQQGRIKPVLTASGAPSTTRFKEIVPIEITDGSSAPQS
jgi:hypothetical protein